MLTAEKQAALFHRLIGLEIGVLFATGARQTRVLLSSKPGGASIQ